MNLQEVVTNFDTTQEKSFEDYVSYWNDICQFYPESGYIIFSTCSTIYRPCSDIEEALEWLSIYRPSSIFEDLERVGSIPHFLFENAKADNFQQKPYVIYPNSMLIDLYITIIKYKMSSSNL